MAETQTLQRDAAFGRGLALGREYADLASRRLAAWAEENPGQLLLAGLAAGFVLGKLLFRKRSLARILVFVSAADWGGG